MKTVNIPFNLRILNPEDQRFKAIKPVTSMEIFDNSKINFHPEGLFSTEIFGMMGDDIRYKTFSYIRLKTKIFQPIIYKALTEGNSLHEAIMAGKKHAVWDDKEKNFIQSDPMNGQTGYNFFLKHWRDIIFPETQSPQRKEQYNLITNYKHEAMIDKVLVIPAGLRDIVINEDERYEEDEINKMYRRLLAVTNTIVEGNSAEVSDLVKYKIQKTFNEIYEYLKSMIDGKKKLMRGKWASRNIVDGTRNVISPMDESITDLNDESAIGPNNTVIGLYQALKAARPIAIFEFKDKFLNKIDLQDHHKVLLINKDTLKQEEVQLGNKEYDLFFTDNGINDVFSELKNEDMFHSPAMVGNHYLSLIYIGDKYINDVTDTDDDGTFTENIKPEKVVKLLNDIHDLPKELNRDNVRPATYAELIYLSVEKKLNTLPLYVTRYPVATLGSIYPSLTYIRTTVESEKRYVLDDNWNLNRNQFVVSFPLLHQRFVSTVNPNPIRLGNLGAD